MLKSVTTTAPGKIILTGEHAVVYGKEAIAFSVNTTTTCCAELLEEKMLRIAVEDLSLNTRFDLNEIQYLCNSQLDKDAHEKPGFHINEDMLLQLVSSESDPMKKSALKMILSLYIHILHSFVVQRSAGVQLVFKTKLPIGGGLGSSASFAVSSASAMLVLCGALPNVQKKWMDKDYTLINDWAFQAEKIIHGTPSGIDNSVSTYGQCLSFKNGCIERMTLSALEIQVLVVNTGKERSTKQLVAGVRERKEKYPLIYTSLMESIEHVANRFKGCLQMLTNQENSYTSVYKELEDLTDINQHLLDAIGVGHDSIQEVVTICSQFHLHAKLTGAGGGGCVFAIVPPSFSVETIQQVQMKLLELKYTSWITTLGGDGVTLKSVT